MMNVAVAAVAGGLFLEMPRLLMLRDHFPDEEGQGKTVLAWM